MLEATLINKDFLKWLLKPYWVQIQIQIFYWLTKRDRLYQQYKQKLKHTRTQKTTTQWHKNERSEGMKKFIRKSLCTNVDANMDFSVIQDLFGELAKCSETHPSVSLHLTSSPDKFSWCLLFAGQTALLMLWANFVKKKIDGSTLMMRSRHIISNTNPHTIHEFATPRKLI